MTEAIIVDIDGTLSDIEHRRHYIETRPKDWKNFFKEMEKDPVNQWCKDLMEIVNCQKILLTGRPDIYRKPTENWLKKHGIPYDLLLMRKRGDFRKDTIVKKELYEEYVKGKFHINFVLEDKPDVGVMWRDVGLHCLLYLGI